MGELFPFRRAGFPAGSSEGYPPEMVAMLQKCQAVRKHEVPGQGAGDWEGIEDNKKPPENSSIGVFRRLLSCNAIKAIALMAIHLSFLVSNDSVQALLIAFISEGVQLSTLSRAFSNSKSKLFEPSEDLRARKCSYSFRNCQIE